MFAQPQVSQQLMEVVKHLEEVRHQAQEVVVEANGLVLLKVVSVTLE